MIYHLLTKAIIGFANLEVIRTVVFMLQLPGYGTSVVLWTWRNMIWCSLNLQLTVMVILPLFSCTVALTLEGPIWGFRYFCGCTVYLMVQMWFGCQKGLNPNLFTGLLHQELPRVKLSNPLHYIGTLLHLKGTISNLVFHQRIKHIDWCRLSLC